jgi:hypothetical protein
MLKCLPALLYMSQLDGQTLMTYTDSVQNSHFNKLQVGKT